TSLLHTLPLHDALPTWPANESKPPLQSATSVTVEASSEPVPKMSTTLSCTCRDRSGCNSAGRGGDARWVNSKVHFSRVNQYNIRSEEHTSELQSPDHLV